MYFFKSFDEKNEKWSLLEGFNAQEAAIIKTSDGKQNLQSFYPNQIDLIIDDLERFGEVQINDGVIVLPQNSLYHIYSLSFYVDELRSELNANLSQKVI